MKFLVKELAHAANEESGLRSWGQFAAPASSDWMAGPDVASH